MLDSHTRWKSLQANAVVSLYPPAGTNAEPQNTSVQVWIEQPGKARVIAGLPDQAPTHIFVSDGQNVRMDSDPVQPPAAFRIGAIQRPDRANGYGHSIPLAGYLGTPVSDLIFPTGLAQRGGEYRLIGKESAAGRVAYLVEWGREPGELIDRFWVDTQTGVILRHQSYGKQDSVTPVSDIRLTAVQFDLDVPDDMFRLDDPSLPALATPLPTLDPAAPQLTILPDLTQVNVRGGPGTTYPVVGGLYSKADCPRGGEKPGRRLVGDRPGRPDRLGVRRAGGFQRRPDHCTGFARALRRNRRSILRLNYHAHARSLLRPSG